MPNKIAERIASSAVFAIGMSLVTQSENIEKGLSRFILDHKTLSTTVDVITFIGVLLILFSISLFVATFILALNWRKRMIPIILIFIGMVFITSGVILWRKQDDLEAKQQAEISHQKNETEQKQDFEIVLPVKNKTKVILYDLKGQDDENPEYHTIYKEIYVIGIKNISQTHKTIYGVNVKMRYSLTQIRGQVQNLSEPSQIRTFEDQLEKKDLNPGDVAYFQFAHSFSYQQCAFFAGTLELPEQYALEKTEYLKMYDSYREEGLFAFENGTKEQNGIIHFEGVYPLRFNSNHDPFLPFAEFEISAQDTPPNKFGLGVARSPNGGINFFPLKKNRTKNFGSPPSRG